VDEKLDMSQQYALTMQKTNCILGGTKTGAASRAREAILLLTLTSQGHTWSTAYRYSLIVIKEKGFKLKEERSRTDFRGKCLTRKEALEQVVQGSRDCPIPGGIQGQVGWGSGKANLVDSNTTYSR